MFQDATDPIKTGARRPLLTYMSHWGLPNVQLFSFSCQETIHSVQSMSHSNLLFWKFIDQIMLMSYSVFTQHLTLLGTALRNVLEKRDLVISRIIEMDSSIWFCTGAIFVLCLF